MTPGIGLWETRLPVVERHAHGAGGLKVDGPA